MQCNCVTKEVSSLSLVSLTRLKLVKVWFNSTCFQLHLPLATILCIHMVFTPWWVITLHMLTLNNIIHVSVAIDRDCTISSGQW